MSDTWTDPGSLEGDALAQWYQRSPADVERERQEAAERRYRNFFYGNDDADPDPGFSQEAPAGSQDIDPGFTMPGPASPEEIDPGFTWISAGPNRWRSVKAGTDSQSIGSSPPVARPDGRPLITANALRSDVSYRQPASAPPPRQPPIDPSKTPVFQTGPDGKLHPIPGWHTTGPFDFGAWSHNIHWGGVAKDLGEIGTGVAAVFSGVGLGGELLSALGPEAETAVAEGIAESPAAKAAADAIHSHHVDPKYMGGAADGETVDLEGRLHRAFHSMLEKAHREVGFPLRGGKSGSGLKWAEHYELNPGTHDEAYEILRRVSREFDEMYGTNISSKLTRTPGSTEVGPPPPK